MISKLVWKFDLGVVDTPSGILKWSDQRVFSVVEKKPFGVLLRNQST
jgi:hypothetical protein